jgi:hypothetical protein
MEGAFSTEGTFSPNITEVYFKFSADKFKQLGGNWLNGGG